MREFNTKTTKGNYSITFETDDKKAFEQVQSLCRILIDGKDGRAISVEWLEDWWKKHSEEYSSGKGCWYEVQGFYPNIFNKLLSAWEKENDD